MNNGNGRKERLHRLIDFARAYRGWSRIRTAQALNRDSTKLYPKTDNPKMDILVGLANLLEWSVDDVVEYIWNGEPDAAAAPNDDFEVLDKQAGQAHRDGQYERMATIARRMYCIARTPEQRARACNREHGAWDGLGRYTKALEAACRGLREHPLPLERRHQLQGNLANTHYTLWELTSALAHANTLTEWYLQHPPETDNQRKRHAFAHYVRGHTLRRLAAKGGPQSATHAQSAKDDLTMADRCYLELAEHLDDERLAGIAHTCRGGLIEVGVILNENEPEQAVDKILDRLDDVVDPKSAPTGDWLESYGWWCVFGANIALRHLTGRVLQHSMAIFTDKAFEIAGRMDNWALRERVFTMQYALHQKLVDTTGLELPFVVDDDERRLITGTIGRFPGFRTTGWRILQAAGMIESTERN